MPERIEHTLERLVRANAQLRQAVWRLTWLSVVVVSLLLATGAIVVLWLSKPEVSWGNPRSGTAYTVSLNRGYLAIRTLRRLPPSTPLPARVDWGAAGLGHSRWTEELREGLMVVTREGTLYHPVSGHLRHGKSYVSVVWLLLLAVILIAPRGAKALLAARRAAGACCRACGYDLRATPDRCPECGAVPADAPGAAA